jgi:hypothetical protein
MNILPKIKYDRKESDLTVMICLGCTQRCIIGPGDSPYCGVCYFKDRILKPMLAEFAPEAVLSFVPATGNFVAMNIADGTKRHVIFRTPKAWQMHWMIDAHIAPAYEGVRQLIDGNYRFDWQKIGALDNCDIGTGHATRLL